ncbi:hypothetical protein [Corynebacterium falsenii]|uniref:hypothetical protein n=1 Tax=Corynebacterium falsenii TaxID=108486 RepID=UPI003FD5EEC8
MSSDDVQVYSDGDGIAVFGEESQVDAFLERWKGNVLAAFPKENYSASVRNISTISRGIGEIQAQSGKWLKLSDESVALLKKAGPSFSKKNGLMYGVVRNPKGQLMGHLQFTKAAIFVPGPHTFIAAGAVLAQVAAEQQMKEISKHLESIEDKLDYVLKDLKGSLFAELEGATASIDKAMVLREETGRVNEVTWSQVQGVQSSIYLIQSKALRRLMNLADTLEADASVADRLTAIGGVEGELTDLLAALSETFRLQDAFYIVELDRVMETDSDDLESHREAVQRSRKERVEKVTEVTTQLLERIYASGKVSRTERLRMLKKPELLIEKCNSAANEVVQTQVLLGADTTLEELESQTWTDALREVRDGALNTTRKWGESAADGINEAKDDFNVMRAKRIRKKLEKIEGKTNRDADADEQTEVAEPEAVETTKPKKLGWKSKKENQPEKEQPEDS